MWEICGYEVFRLEESVYNEKSVSRFCLGITVELALLIVSCDSFVPADLESWGRWDVRPSEAADCSNWDLHFDEGLREVWGRPLAEFKNNF